MQLLIFFVELYVVNRQNWLLVKKGNAGKKTSVFVCVCVDRPTTWSREISALYRWNWSIMEEDFCHLGYTAHYIMKVGHLSWSLQWSSSSVVGKVQLMPVSQSFVSCMLLAGSSMLLLSWSNNVKMWTVWRHGVIEPEHCVFVIHGWDISVCDLCVKPPHLRTVCCAGDAETLNSWMCVFKHVVKVK